MPDFTSITIVDSLAGPERHVVFELDRNGIRDNAGAMYGVSQQVTVPINAQTTQQYAWTCVEGTWKVQGVHAVKTTAGEDTEVDVCIVRGSTDMAAGNTVLVRKVSLNADAATVSQGQLLETDQVLNSGDSLLVSPSGSLTAVQGTVTIVLKRIG